jgi:hypothetical protein
MRRVRARFDAQPSVQRLQPAQLVRVFLSAAGRAVGHVQVHDAKSIERRGEQPTRRVVALRDARHHRCARRARPERDAVMGFLAASDRMVAVCRELVMRKIGVGEFHLLQREHIDRAAPEPLQYLWQAYAQGVDVPGSDAHGRQ